MNVGLRVASVWLLVSSRCGRLWKVARVWPICKDTHYLQIQMFQRLPQQTCFRSDFFWTNTCLQSVPLGEVSGRHCTWMCCDTLRDPCCMPLLHYGTATKPDLLFFYPPLLKYRLGAAAVLTSFLYVTTDYLEFPLKFHRPLNFMSWMLLETGKRFLYFHVLLLYLLNSFW